MNNFKGINILRRKITKGITKNIGNSSINKNTKPLQKVNVKRILVSRPNHRLGNLLLITPLIQDISRIFPNAKIDVFVKGNLGPIVFKNYENVDRIIKLPKKHFKEIFQYLRGWLRLKKLNYDIVINVVQNSSSGRLSTKIAKANYKFYGGNEENGEYTPIGSNHIAKAPVYNFRNYLFQLGMQIENTAVPQLNLKLSAAEIAEGNKMLKELIKKDEKTICLFTYATGSKCYDEAWWLKFHSRLKQEYPNLNFVEVLPVENVSQISFKEPSFYSKDIREICAFIANTDIFIGADSGIMHLASASGTPTMGLFMGKTDVYEPCGPKSLGFSTHENNLDEAIKEINNILCA